MLTGLTIDVALVFVLNPNNSFPNIPKSTYQHILCRNPWWVCDIQSDRSKCIHHTYFCTNRLCRIYAYFSSTRSNLVRTEVKYTNVDLPMQPRSGPPEMKPRWQTGSQLNVLNRLTHFWLVAQLWSPFAHSSISTQRRNELSYSDPSGHDGSARSKE